MRYRLVIAYDGTDFLGWQKQLPPDPDADPDARDPATGQRPRVELRTVQSVVEHAVRDVLREPVSLLGASRTDSGVHALGQVAAFTTEPKPEAGVGWPADRGVDRLVKAVNARLPRDVLVRDARLVDDAFNPIAHAQSKQYSYTFVCGPDRPLWQRRYAFHTRYRLDADAMAAAAAALVGEHDFASFAQINHGRTSTVRTIHACSVERIEPASLVGSPVFCDPLPMVRIRVSGSGFLYNMVRIIAGTLMEVGRGATDAASMPAILERADRRAAGPTLPPQGLRLEWIRYPDDAPSDADADGDPSATAAAHDEG